MKKKNPKKEHSSALILSVLFAVIFAFSGLIIYYQAAHAPRTVTTTKAATSAQSDNTIVPQKTQEAQAVQKEDAQTYYSENSKELRSVTPAEKSSRALSEKAAAKEFTERGFGEDTPVTYEYAMDGSALEKAEINTASAAKHPQYSSLYITQSGEYWTISVCNDCVTAYPVTYNLEHNNGTEVIFSEGDSIIAYDSATNCFYETVPKPSVLVLKQIPAITAEALERLTAEEIEKL